MKAAVLLLLLMQGAFAAGLENIACERTATGAIRITFNVSPDAGKIAIYSSSRPDTIDTLRAIVTDAGSPTEIPITGTQRVYFHLKPEHGATRVTALRQLDEPGTNFLRDVGGYQSSDGRYVRWGLIYRSGNLSHYTPATYSFAASLGLRVIADLRMPEEPAFIADEWPGAAPPELLNLPMRLSNPGVNAGGQSAPWFYTTSVAESTEQFAALLHTIASGDLPILIHCNAGRDRTGVAVAFLLTALGVPLEIVKQDYTLIKAPPADPEWLDAAFLSIRQKYGSFDTYLRDTLHLSNTDLTALRDRLLER